MDGFRDIQTFSPTFSKGTNRPLNFSPNSKGDGAAYGANAQHVDLNKYNYRAGFDNITNTNIAIPSIVAAGTSPVFKEESMPKLSKTRGSRGKGGKGQGKIKEYFPDDENENSKSIDADTGVARTASGKNTKWVAKGGNPGGKGSRTSTNSVGAETAWNLGAKLNTSKSGRSDSKNTTTSKSKSSEKKTPATDLPKD